MNYNSLCEREERLTERIRALQGVVKATAQEIDTLRIELAVVKSDKHRIVRLHKYPQCTAVEFRRLVKIANDGDLFQRICDGIGSSTANALLDKLSVEIHGIDIIDELHAASLFVRHYEQETRNPSEN